jgi:hypothetical protein
MSEYANLHEEVPLTESPNQVAKQLVEEKEMDGGFYFPSPPCARADGDGTVLLGNTRMLVDVVWLTRIRKRTAI